MRIKTKQSYLRHLFLTMVATFLLASCGGGGSTVSPPEVTQPEPPPTSPPPTDPDPEQVAEISGNAQLGRIIGADVTLSDGAGAVLETFVTDASGNYGPASILEPAPDVIVVEITPAADGSSVFVCDYPSGCPNPAGGPDVPFGDTLPYTATLSAVVSGAEDATRANVTPFTTAVHQRAIEVGLTSAGVQQADQEMAAVLESLLDIEIDGSIADLPNIDLVDVSGNPTETSDAALQVAFLNAGLFSLAASSGRSLDQIVGSMVESFRAGGELTTTESFNGDVIGTRELLFAAESQITLMMSSQPAIVQSLTAAVPGVDLQARAERLASTRNTIAAEPPAISGTPPAATAEDAPFSFTPVVTDADSISFTFSGQNLPGWASLNTLTGELSGVPAAEDDVGTYAGISISVTDGAATDTLTFDLEVLPTNDPPTIAGSPATSVQEGENYSFTPTASDPDGPSVSFFASNLPSWATFEPDNGTIAGSPDDADTGVFSDIVVSVTDGLQSASLPAFSITVIATNDQPKITGAPPTDRISIGTAFFFQPNATDEDGDSLSFTISGLPSWAGFDSATGALAGTPASGDIGSYGPIVISVSDGAEVASLPAFSLDVVSGLALFNDTAETTVGQSVAIDALANDTGIQGSTTVEVVAGSVTGGTVSIGGGNLFTFTPEAGFAGLGSFEYRVTDSTSASDTATVSVDVDDIPVAVADSATTSAQTGVTIDVLTNDTGLGNAPVSVKISGSVSNGAASVSAQNLVTFVPASGFFGSTSFQYQVSDADGDIAIGTVTVTVDDIPSAFADVAGAAVNGPGVTIDVLANDLGLGDAPITLSIESGTAVGGTAAVSSPSSILFTPAADFDGDGSFDYRVTDADGDFSIATVLVTLDDQPNAQADTVSAESGTSTSIAVLENDTGLSDTPVALSIVSGSVTGGSAIVNPSTSRVEFTPAGTAAGGFEYQITDADGDTSTAAVSVTVNVVPVANNDVGQTVPNSTLIINVLANDTSLVETPITITIVSATNGTATTSGNIVAFTPSAGFVGIASITYQIEDASGDTSTAVISVTVDDQPAAVNDGGIAVPSDTPVAINVLENDSGLLQGPITVTIVSGSVVGGTTSVSGGVVTFTPSSGFSGVASFDYVVTDADGDTSQATVTMTVDSKPVAVDDNVETGQDVPIVINVLANDSGLDDLPLNLALVASSESNGTVSQSGNEFTFTPTAGFVGTGGFEYTVTDNDGDSDQGTVTVLVDDLPNAVADSATTPVGVALPVTVLGNDTGLANTPIAVTIEGGTLVGGTASVDGSNVITFTPTGGFGGSGGFTYRVTDFDGDTTTAAVSIFVDDTPVAVDDTGLETPVATPIDVNVATNDTGLLNPPLTVTTSSLVGGTTSVSGTTVTFTPTGGFGGDASFDYQIEDSNGDTASASVAIFVEDTPVAVDDTGLTTPVTVALPVNVTTNDSGLLNTPLTITTSNLVGGTTSVSGTTVTFTPAGGFGGDASFDYQIEDSDGDTASASVSIFVEDTPVANADSVETPINTALTNIDVLSNDTGLNNTPVTVALVASSETGGTVAQSGDLFTFTPTTDFAGAGSFDYQITDDDGDTATATVTVFVDDTPVAVADAGETPRNTPIDFTVLSNDTGLGNTPVVVNVVSETNGTTSVSSNVVTFTPTTDFSGAASFDYQITDDDGDQSTATVSITVTDLLAVADSTTVNVGSSISSYDVLANDIVFSPPVTVTIVSDPSNGTASVNGDNTIDYTPDGGFGGTDTLTYRVTDNDSDTSDATLSIFVNDTPVANDDGGNVTPGVTPILIAVLANDTGLLNTPVTVTTDVPTNGTATVDGSNQITYVPGLSFFGTETFDYTIEDSDGDTATATVTVFVDDEPVPTTDTAKFDRGDTVLIPVQSNDTGLGNPPITMVIETPPSVGVATIVGDQIQFVSDADFPCGGDSLQYRLTDSDGDTAVGTVNLEVAPFDGYTSVWKPQALTPFDGEGKYGPGGLTPCSYTPPIGIGKPFGVTETHEVYDGVSGYLDAGNGPYTHYVDSTDSGCDSSNFPGTAADPICEIPTGDVSTPIPAGSVIEIHGGPYTYSGRTYWYPGGSEAEPVYFRGVDDGSGYPIVRSDTSQTNVFVSGTYGIVEHLRFIDIQLVLGCPDNHNECDELADKNNLMARFVEVRSNVNGRNGMDLYNEYMSIFSAEIHHNQDERRHGIVIRAGSDHTYVLDSYLHHNGDNNIQYTDGAELDQANFVYIGRNRLEHAREVGLATKWVQKTVVSENVIFDYQPSVDGGSFCWDDKAGEPLVCQDPLTSAGPGTGIIVGADGFPQSKWILFNRIYDTPYCIRIEEAVGTYIIGNQCYGASTAGIRLEKDSPTLEISHNTFHDVEIPILEDFQPNFWDPELHNNIFTNPGSYALRWTQTNARVDSNWENNLFWNNGSSFDVNWHGNYTINNASEFEVVIEDDSSTCPTSGVEGCEGQPDGTVVRATASGTLVVDPLLVDPDNTDNSLVDLSLGDGSPGIGAANSRLTELDTTFKSIFGGSFTIIPPEWSDNNFDLGAIPKEE